MVYCSTLDLLYTHHLNTEEQFGYNTTSLPQIQNNENKASGDI